MEELNQVQDETIVTNEEENLFADYEGTEDTPIEETKQEADTVETVEEDKPVETTQSTNELKVTFNGEERTLTMDQAKELAQKGLNYDRFYEPLQRLARMNNVNSVGDLINMLEETQVQFEISKEVDSLRNDPKYENVSDEILEEIATSRVNENINIQDKNYREYQQSRADAEQQEIMRQVELFTKEYPNVNPDNVDEQVFQYYRQGYTLLEAYQKWARGQEEKNKPIKEAQEKISKQNEENKKRSLGNTTNAGSVEADDFLNGFLKG